MISEGSEIISESSGLNRGDSEIAFEALEPSEEASRALPDGWPTSLVDVAMAGEPGRFASECAKSLPVGAEMAPEGSFHITELAENMDASTEGRPAGSRCPAKWPAFKVIRISGWAGLQRRVPERWSSPPV